MGGKVRLVGRSVQRRPCIKHSPAGFSGPVNTRCSQGVYTGPGVWTERSPAAPSAEMLPNGHPSLGADVGVVGNRGTGPDFAMVGEMVSAIFGNVGFAVVVLLSRGIVIMIDSDTLVNDTFV